MADEIEGLAGVAENEFDDMDEGEENITKLKESAKKKKGRGFGGDSSAREDITNYENMEADGDEPGPARCKL